MTLGSHQTAIGKSQSHITPRWILEALGPFELDPCAADPRPWSCATVNLTANGFEQRWTGRTWLNPPFNRHEVGRWIDRLARHGDGIALLHARTEAGWFEPIWRSAAAILFMARRIKFCRPDGSKQPANSGAPPVLAAFGRANAEHLKRSGIPGSLVTGWTIQGSRIESLSRADPRAECHGQAVQL
jgi:hypothetical protein